MSAPSKHTGTLIAVIVGIVAVIVLALVMKRPAQEATTPEQDQEAQRTTSLKTFSYLLPEEWTMYERASAAVQSLGKNQTIQFGVVNDPSQEEIVYFATTSPGAGDTSTLVSVYRYNTSDYHFERLYKKDYAPGEFNGLREEAAPVFHVIGYDNGNLIILAQDGDDSPGPCTEPLTLGRDSNDLMREVVSMSIEHPYDGLVSYTIPDHIYQAAKDKENDCVENGP